MAEKQPKDPRFEGRFRAHVRRRMERLGWGPSLVAEKTGFDQGYISKWLLEQRGSRGASALFFLQVCVALGLDPIDVFKTDPEDRFWRAYSPREREENPPPASASAARPTRPMGARAAEGEAPYAGRKKKAP